jgi:hypothetical protein
MRAHGDLSLKGIGYPTPSNQCWPDGVPYIFWQYGMQMLQEKDKVAILYLQDHQFRQVRLNQPHPAHVTPLMVRRFGRPLRRRHAGHRHRGREDRAVFRWPTCTIRPTGRRCMWWNATSCSITRPPGSCRHRYFFSNLMRSWNTSTLRACISRPPSPILPSSIGAKPSFSASLATSALASS